MKALCKTFLLLLASVTLTSCGGGGGGSNSAFGPPGNDTTLSLSATTTTLPQSPCSIGAEQTAPFPCNFPGSPYIAEVTVTWRHKDGQLVGGTTPVNVSVAPVTVIAFSFLSTKTDNFHPLLGSGPIDVTAGVGTIFVHAGQAPGHGVLTVTGIDPVSKQTITAQLNFTVVGVGTNLPTSIFASSQGAVYIASSGGAQSTIVNARVTDGSNAFVPDPSGFDNVEFEIIGPAGNDARLTGVNAAGQSVTGTKVDTVTHGGIAAITFLAGSQQGPVQVRATADRADGNVDNGISDPISSTATVVVSDGRLFSLTLTSPVAGIFADKVDADVDITIHCTPPDVPCSLPPLANGVYSYVVTAHATDRQGNPILPNTPIRFGEIDAPVNDNDGTFEIFGVAGNPQEGGTLFTATDGAFTTAGGGAGPGDTLLVFGKDVLGHPVLDGNADLESAAKVASIQNGQTLHVQNPFNWNDTTGNSVDYGPVLPYIIGRAQIGNISSPSPVLTNNVGDATTTLNYPASRLGHITAIWAQGDGVNTATHPGSTDLVTDIEIAAFYGVAPATIVISPNPIPGNITIPVQVCIKDALGSPLSGVVFNFTFSNLGVGSGTLDGISTAGTVPQVTDASGCVNTTVATTGIASSSGGTGVPGLTFTAGTATATAPITAGGGLALLAKPSALGGNGGTVTLSLLNSNGTPVPGVQLVGTCTGATVGIASGPGVTNAQGQTTVVITADLNQPNAPGSGSCTFTTTTGSPTVTVNLQGIDPCKSGVSPLPTGCTITPPTPSTVTLNVVSGATNTASFTSNPPGASCSGVKGSTQTCSATLNGGTYLFTAVPTGATPTAVTWSGSCTPSGTNKATLIVPTAATTGLTCTATEP